MTKPVDCFFVLAKATAGAASKFTATLPMGHQILPTRDKNAEWQMRLEAGHVDKENQKLHVHLRVNTEATSNSLTKYRNENGAKAKLASEVFDLAAEDKEAELERMSDAMAAQAKEKLG